MKMNPSAGYPTKVRIGETVVAPGPVGIREKVLAKASSHARKLPRYVPILSAGGKSVSTLLVRQRFGEWLILAAVSEFRASGCKWALPGVAGGKATCVWAAEEPETKQNQTNGRNRE